MADRLSTPGPVGGGNTNTTAAVYILQTARLVHEMISMGLVNVVEDTEQVGSLDVANDDQEGCDDIFWQAPEATHLARISGLMSFEFASADTSSLATCQTCQSFSMIEACLKVVRKNTTCVSGQISDPDPMVRFRFGGLVCPECGKLPAILAVIRATKNRLANEEKWRANLAHIDPAPSKLQMRVCHTHKQAQAQSLSLDQGERICYTRLYDWHKYLGTKTEWQYGTTVVQADYVPTVCRFFAGCIGATRLGAEGVIASGRGAGWVTALDSVVSKDEEGYEIEDSVVQEHLALLAGSSLADREGLLAAALLWLCRVVLDDLKHTISTDTGKLVKLNRVEALAIRSSDLDAELGWAMATGWSKKQFLQLRANLMSIDGPSSEVVLEVLGLQTLYNDIVGYVADVATDNLANVIYWMESAGESAGPLAELEDTHWRMVNLAETFDGASDSINELVRVSNGTACFH